MGTEVNQGEGLVPLKLLSTYVAIDLETSGLPEKDDCGNQDFSKVCVLRIGAVICQQSAGQSQEMLDAEKLDRFDVMVKPEPGIEVKEKSLKVNGLSLEILHELGVPIAEALRLFECFALRRTTRIIVGHNVLGFDIPLLLRWGMSFPVYSVAFDTMAIWKAFAVGISMLKDEDEERFQRMASRTHREVKSRLDHLAMIFFGGDAVRTGPHSPVQDALLSANVFEAMRRRGILKQVFGY